MYLLTSLCILMLCYSCSNQVAGVETTNGIVTAVVYTNDGAAASQATVKLVPVEYNPVKDDALPDYLSGTTDGNGKHVFTVPESGSYNLLASYNKTRLYRAGILIEEDNITIVDTLRETGAAKIELADSVDTLTSYLYIPGTDLYHKFIKDNNYYINKTIQVVFGSIPAATIPGIYFGKADTLFNPVPLTDVLTITPNDTIDITITQVVWSTYTTANSDLPDDVVCALMVDNTGVLWAGMEMGGLAAYDGSSWKVWDMQNTSLPSNIVRAVAQGLDGTIWVATAGGMVSILNDVMQVYTMANTGLSYHSVTAVAIDSAGHVWFGATEGCIEFDGTKWIEHTASINYILMVFVNALAVDREGVLLVGTKNGLFTNDKTKWGLVSSSTYPEAVHDIAVDADNRWWMATDNGLVHYHDTWTLIDNAILGSMNPNLKSVAVDWNNDVWAGSYFDGNIIKFSSPTVLYNHLNTNVLNGIATINDISIGSDKTMYFATKYNGIVTVHFSK